MGNNGKGQKWPEWQERSEWQKRTECLEWPN